MGCSLQQALGLPGANSYESLICPGHKTRGRARVGTPRAPTQPWDWLITFLLTQSHETGGVSSVFTKVHVCRVRQGEQVSIPPLV